MKDKNKETSSNYVRYMMMVDRNGERNLMKIETDENGNDVAVEPPEPLRFRDGMTYEEKLRVCKTCKLVQKTDDYGNKAIFLIGWTRDNEEVELYQWKPERNK